MNAFKELLRLLNKVYLIVKERIFLIPPPETHPPQPSSFMGEGMGGDDIQKEYQLVEKLQLQPSQVYTSGGGEVLEKERTVTVHLPPPLSGTGQALTPPTRGGGKTVPPPRLGRPSGGAELLQRTSDFEMSPLLEDQRISLCETLDRVLNTGVVVHGDITISVANIDLIYIGLRALLTSVETARQAGINHK